MELLNGGTIFPSSTNFLPAPFLSNAFNEADTDDCFGLIRILITDAHAFDTEHGEDGKNPLAKENIEETCLFLFGIGKGLIAETCFSVVPDDTEMENYSAKRHADFIQPPAGFE